MQRLVNWSFAFALAASLSGFSGAPPATAKAAPAARCGALLIAGLAVCEDWLMKKSEYEGLVKKALRGDNDAAGLLSTFYRMGGKPREQEKWLLLAARRGDCWSIRQLIDIANETGRSRYVSILTSALGHFRCPAEN